MRRGACLGIAALLSGLAGCNPPVADKAPSAASRPADPDAPVADAGAPAEPVASIAVSLPEPESYGELALRQSMNATLALQYDGRGGPVPLSPDDGLAGFMRAGLIGREPDAAADYQQWYVPRRPVRFLGYPLLAIISEDIRGPWIGCCVNRGNAVLIDASGGTVMAEAFAQANGCRLQGDADYDMDYFRQIPELRRLVVLAPDQVILSCKEDDAAGQATDAPPAVNRPTPPPSPTLRYR